MPEEPKFVVYNGARMIWYWPERIQQAQRQPLYLIEGQQWARVRYGEETQDWEAEKLPCHDCRVIKGQFHVPSCDVEQCPRCGEQALSCDCELEDVAITDLVAA